MIIKTDDDALLYLGFCGGEAAPPPRGASSCEGPVAKRVFAQLDEYFAGERREFDLPLKMFGTTFQMAVWAGLLQIPYGQTVSYGQLAAMIGKPKASRAVGGANHVNPISIIVPCHRVIGAGGSLTGYGGGLEMKRFLLELER
ncbi:MAG: methylated-DNA--[protein]-cysteine S-methyltransferase [Oscillospiraceae bacterium]|nr:methylated-DNA--[protein]-cysteine S-methyltransferase [Oscillospiraceae bacterium]